ncbi:MAG: hypothetical protein A2Y38_19445 [Spirochaetes bacterium GWB1_59_5]|nr:MAG: hypothetical protein A2Y38_19445 [Spirochaetes bacterium GWB1_59_5]
MIWVLYLLASFGLAFGIQNKLPFLHGRYNLLDSLLQCPYCLGFWTGWATWGLSWAIHGKPVLHPVEACWWQYPLAGLIWAFASSVVCYVLYVSIVWLEDSLERK